jgi:hypothetical protein
MSFSKKRVDAPIAAGGPPPMPPWRPHDPFRALDELMEVLEALCPALPEPPIRRIGTDYRL